MYKYSQFLTEFHAYEGEKHGVLTFRHIRPRHFCVIIALQTDTYLIMNTNALTKHLLGDQSSTTLKRQMAPH